MENRSYFSVPGGGGLLGGVLIPHTHTADDPDSIESDGHIGSGDEVDESGGSESDGEESDGDGAVVV